VAAAAAVTAVVVVWRLDKPVPAVVVTPSPVIMTTIVPVTAPAVTPAPREAGTPFYDALPSAVARYALVGSAADDQFKALGAFDAYALTYSDGESQVEMLAGQWRTPELAQSALEAIQAAAGEHAADTWLAWRNETAVFTVQTAADGGADRFARAFPM
jgi:hypothetical protein